MARLGEHSGMAQVLRKRTPARAMASMFGVRGGLPAVAEDLHLIDAYIVHDEKQDIRRPTSRGGGLRAVGIGDPQARAE
jgi:hypothetical protein